MGKDSMLKNTCNICGKTVRIDQEESHLENHFPEPSAFTEKHRKNLFSLCDEAAQLVKKAHFNQAEELK